MSLFDQREKSKQEKLEEKSTNDEGPSISEDFDMFVDTTQPDNIVDWLEGIPSDNL
jgi:hypothetical protein